MISGELQHLLQLPPSTVPDSYFIFLRFIRAISPLSGNSSDIIDHGILLWIKCPLVPEQSYISHKNGNYFALKMTAPYNYTVENLLECLQRCCQTKDFKFVHFKYEIIREGSKDFVELQIPYSVLDETQMSAIEECLDSKYKDIKSYQYYNYCKWTRLPITMDLIDNTIKSYLNIQLEYDYFFFTKEDVWEAIGKFVDPSKKNSCLDNADREVANTFEHFPCVYVTYDSYNGEKMSIQTTRDQILRLFEPTRSYKTQNPFLVQLKKTIEIKSFKEYKMSQKIVSFMNDYRYTFKFAKVPDTDMYKMSLKPNIMEKLKKFGVKWKPKSEENAYELFDKENFYKALLALCDGYQLFPFEERFFQSRYYIHNCKWDALKEQLHFLLTIKENLSISEDYTILPSKLLKYAIQMLYENDPERGNNILQILFDVLSELKPADRLELKNISMILFEILNISICENEKGEKPHDLIEKLFLYSYRAELPECDLFAAQMYGLPFGEVFETNILEDGLDALFIEVSKRMKLKNNP